MNAQTEMQQFLTREKNRIDDMLPAFISDMDAPEILKEAMVYSLKAGGKRIRPILLLAVMHGLKQPVKNGYKTACAIEMIHTYSLIHDDLPAMDDDDLRRGQPTNHKVYGEAMAILAGDGLLTYSFQIVSSLEHVAPEVKVALIRRISEAAGPAGMVGGQVADMEAEGKSMGMEELQQIHHRKTGDLLSLSLECGALLSSAGEKEVEALREFGKHIGLAFQIKDDLLDVEGDEKEIGKRVGSDESNEKTTYPSILGVEKAKEKLEFHVKEAKAELSKVDMNGEILEELADYIGNRRN